MDLSNALNSIKFNPHDALIANWWHPILIMLYYKCYLSDMKQSTRIDNIFSLFQLWCTAGFNYRPNSIKHTCK